MILDLSISSRVSSGKRLEKESINKQYIASKTNNVNTGAYQPGIKQFSTRKDMNTNSNGMWLPASTNSYFTQPAISAAKSNGLGVNNTSGQLPFIGDYSLQKMMNSYIFTDLPENTHHFFRKCRESLVRDNSVYLDEKPCTAINDGIKYLDVDINDKSIPKYDGCQLSNNENTDTPFQTSITPTSNQETIIKVSECLKNPTNTNNTFGNFVTVNESIRIKREDSNENIDSSDECKDQIVNLHRDRHKHIARLNSLHGKLNKGAVVLMNRWYRAHIDHPYPTIDEKFQLAELGKITYAQVSSWFANRRNRSSNTWPKRIKLQLFEKLRMIANDIEEATDGSVNGELLCAKICKTIEDHLG